jgi:hypothetical protein
MSSGVLTTSSRASDDVEATVANLKSRGISSTAVSDQGWGLLAEIVLTGGGKLGLFQPRHPITAGLTPV